MEAGLLHVLCGDSAAGSLRSAKACNADAIVVQHDVLSCGPLQQFATLPEWRRLRENFGSSICDHPLYCNQPHDLTDNAHKLSGAPGVVLWMGVGLSDQPLLPSTLYIAELVGAHLPRRLSAICATSGSPSPATCFILSWRSRTSRKHSTSLTMPRPGRA